MGLIQAAVGAAGGALADSWRDFFYCEALNENTLAAKGQKRTPDFLHMFDLPSGFC